ncbi:prolyl 4-hydroxylase [Mactra antiquata]
MQQLPTIFIIGFYLSSVALTHTQESCHVNDVGCQLPEDQIILKTKEQSESWMSAFMDQFETLKNFLFGEPSWNEDRAREDKFNEEMSFGMDEDLMIKYAQSLASSMLEGEQLKVFTKAATEVLMQREDKDADGGIIDDYSDFIYPPVKKIIPHKVGHVQHKELGVGPPAKLITKSLNPPLFEIPNFLSDEQCDHIIKMSEKKGLKESTMFQPKDRTLAGNNKGIERVSYMSFLTGKDIDKSLLNTIHERAADLLDIPKEVVQWSEHLAIGMYNPGGHYYAHLDSNEDNNGVPCCFQKLCYDHDLNEVDYIDCCRMCRYATLLYYLSDVEEGGETAFPLADLTLNEMLNKESTHWQNLTETCHEASVVIKPEKGKAILWYNHFIDRNGYITNVDKRSFHGGCDVIRGQKWIATNWISTPLYQHRHWASKYREKFYEYMRTEDPVQMDHA